MRFLFLQDVQGSMLTLAVMSTQWRNTGHRPGRHHRARESWRRYRFAAGTVPRSIAGPIDAESHNVHRVSCNVYCVSRIVCRVSCVVYRIRRCAPAQRNVDDKSTAEQIVAVAPTRTVVIVPCDLAVKEQVRSVVGRITDPEAQGGLGRTVDILVNCGGIQRRHVVFLVVGGSSAFALILMLFLFL